LPQQFILKPDTDKNRVFADLIGTNVMIITGKARFLLILQA